MKSRRNRRVIGLFASLLAASTAQSRSANPDLPAGPARSILIADSLLLSGGRVEVRAEWFDGPRLRAAIPIQGDLNRYGWFGATALSQPSVIVNVEDRGLDTPLVLSWVGTTTTRFLLEFRNLCSGTTVVVESPGPCRGLDDQSMMPGCEPRATTCGERLVMLPGGVPLDLVCLVGGTTFSMGAYQGERGARSPEYPEHNVTMAHGFYIGKTEVTEAQWSAVMGDPPCPRGEGSDYAVTCVSWHDVAGPSGFIHRLNRLLGTTKFRLPSEAEWEYAARGGASTKTRFYFGDCLEGDDRCEACPEADAFMVYCGNSVVGGQPVATRLPNPFGLFDIHGGEAEWVQDWAASYTRTPVDGTSVIAPDRSSWPAKIARGCASGNAAVDCRTATRFLLPPSFDWGGTGFRLASDP